MDSLPMPIPDPATSTVNLQFDYQQQLLTSYFEGTHKKQDLKEFSQNVEFIDSDKK